MCKYGVQNTLFDSTMSWPWHQKGQVGGVQSFGVASNLTGRQRFHSTFTHPPFQGESGKNSPLLRLDSVGEISSDTEQGAVQDLTMDSASNRNMPNMESAGKYPYTHAADDQLHWFRYGNQFQQAYKMGFNYTQAYMMPQQQRFVGPQWDAVPQGYGQPLGVVQQGFGSFGGAWTSCNSLQQSYPLSFVYTVMGCGQPIYQNSAEALPVWNEANYNQVSSNNIYPKSRMNPNAKPFTPQAMRHQQTVGDYQPVNSITAVRQETSGKGAEKHADVLSDKEENGPVLGCAKKCAAVVSVSSESAPSAIEKSDDDGKVVDQLDTCELTSRASDQCGTNEKHIPSAIIEPSVCEPKSDDDGSSEASAKNEVHGVLGISEASEEGMAQNESKEFSPSFVMSLSSGTCEKMDGSEESKAVGRNMYILSRPRSKKKSKPAAQDRKRRKKRTSHENAGCGSTEGSVTEGKRNVQSRGVAFILGSASSDDDSEDERRLMGNSLLISPLQCDSESGGDSDWDEVDGIASAADFLTDQMCELLPPIMLSVLTIPTSQSLPKSASAPHLHNHSLEAINKRWSETYDSSGVNDIKSVGAKHKKQVHFAREESVSHPLQTVHPVEEYCRRGPWERFAADRCRFKSRITDVQAVINPILCERHRENVFSNRFADSVS